MHQAGEACGGTAEAWPSRRSELGPKWPTRCRTPGSNCTPDHEFRTNKQSVQVEERLASYADHPVQVQVSSSSDANVWMHCIGAEALWYRRGRLAALRSGPEVQSPVVSHARVLNCTPDHEFRTVKQSVL
jgi:hypothetical protein